MTEPLLFERGNFWLQILTVLHDVDKLIAYFKFLGESAEEETRSHCA